MLLPTTPQTPVGRTLEAVFLEKVSIPHRNSLGKVSIQGYNILGKRTNIFLKTSKRLFTYEAINAIIIRTIAR